jgi:hypothetical protein
MSKLSIEVYLEHDTIVLRGVEKDLLRAGDKLPEGWWELTDESDDPEKGHDYALVIKTEMSPARVDIDGDIDSIPAYLLHCAMGWAPNARLIGNARAGDIVEAMRRIVDGKG